MISNICALLLEIWPNSGSLTRQISFLLNNYIYQDGEDTENQGLLIPRYKAGGRTAPNGKVYPDYKGKPNEDDLVPVRSILTKTKGDLNVVTPDLIGKFFKDFTPGAAIGLSFARSLTEGTTQAALGLKHGGHERVLSKDGYLKIDKACTFREEGKWIMLKVRGGELKFPRPDNLVTLGKDKFEKGESVCCAYNTSSPIVKLNSLINLMRARPSAGLRYFEKDNIIVSDCYAYEDGIIQYVEDSDENIQVKIGSREYQYNPECMYYFPDGAEVRKFDRICSGVVNMDHVISELGTNLNDIYLIFRKQFFTLTDGGFVKKGYSEVSSTQEEIIEMLFNGLTRIVYDPKTSKIDELEYMGTQKSVLSRKSFYTVLSYGFSNRVINRALKGDVNIGNDVMTSVILGLLLNNKLDENNK